MIRIRVAYATHQTGYFPVDPEKGWRVDPASRCLVIGHGVPRTMVPLDSVLWFELEEV